MITTNPSDYTRWHSELRLPLVTDQPELLESQILLGGITLVLSRVHPAFARKQFSATNSLALRLVRVIECGDPARGQITSEHLRAALAECERSLDPGSLLMFKKMIGQAMKAESGPGPGGHTDFTYSDFLAEERLAKLSSEPGPEPVDTPHQPLRIP